MCVKEANNYYQCTDHHEWEDSATCKKVEFKNPEMLSSKLPRSRTPKQERHDINGTHATIEDVTASKVL